LAASFPVQRTPAHLSAGKQQCGVNDVPALRPDETDWGALQQMVYRRKISDIDQLKHPATSSSLSLCANMTLSTNQKNT